MKKALRALRTAKGIRNAKLLLVCAVLTAGYVYFLHVKNESVAAHRAALEERAPAKYLNEVRLANGFDRFLDEFRTVRGYDEFKQPVPPFLLGRWTLAKRTRSVNDEYIPQDCIDAIAFEDGRVRAYGALDLDERAEYRLDGDTVKAQLADGKRLEVQLVSYDANLHHLVMRLPGRKDPYYGYLCR